MYFNITGFFLASSVVWLKGSLILLWWILKIGFLIILFATLVYDEIIIINKCNLDYYTKKRIIERGEIDATNFDEFPLLQTVQRDSITEMQPESVK